MPFATPYRPAELGRVLGIGDIDTLITASQVLGKDTEACSKTACPDWRSNVSGCTSWRATP